ncbi:centriolar and ciliogenesis-associated protein HYLS1-like [Amphiura filiformis]|uniref:centriolar and ciliogenesis-associated protein HYLS1-like n=1 Tax=Amphiura filiformis TaxID=82378 RepID=UPI003B210DFF
MDESDSSLHFSEEDIRTQLELLGYQDVPTHRLRQFATDLERLIANDSTQGGQYYDDRSVVSDLSSNVTADDSTRPHNVEEAPPGVSREAYRPEYHKQYIPVHRDHTKYGKENYTYQDHRSEMAPAYNPKSHLIRPDPNELLDSSIASSRSEDPQRKPWWPPAEKKAPMKRKVLRKKGGHSQVFDESITESETDDISYLNDRFHGISIPGEDDEDTASVVTDSDTSSIHVTHHGPSRRRPVSASALYAHRPSGDEDTVFKPHLPRSFIRPDSAQPKSKYRHDPKTDPVSRHQMYQAAWNAKKAPGEKSRKDLRWNVREQMMYKHELPKPQNQPRVYVPNTYKVPTDKKRQALRWAVRTSLANKQMPYTSFES